MLKLNFLVIFLRIVFTTLVIGFVRLNEDTFVIPYSNSFKKNHPEKDFN